MLAICVGSVRTRESSLAVYDRSYRNAMTSQLMLPTLDRYVSFGTGFKPRTILTSVRPGVIIGYGHGVTDKAASIFLVKEIMESDVCPGMLVLMSMPRKS